jgi:hypothetical protein
MLEEEIWWLDGALLYDEALSSDACKVSKASADESGDPEPR